jgi:DNA/RNA endonuclease G (NUC1)
MFRETARVNADTRVIVVDMTNSNAIGRGSDWHSFRFSVASYESTTGLRFLTNVPVSVRNALLNKVDNVP